MRVPFGYRIESIQDSKAQRGRWSGRLIADPRETAIIRKIFKRAAKGGAHD